jgi:hypothetical protein
VSKSIDARIQEEFERLGLNIVESDRLADLIITRVRRDRMRRILGGFGVATLAALAIAFVVTTSSDSSGSSSQVTGSSLSFTQEATEDGSQALPQAGYWDIDGSVPSKSVVSYLFNLQQGWILEEITDSPNPSMGEVGLVEVYRVLEGSEDQLVQQYQMSSRTQINEFGVPMTGQYRFVLKFTDPTFKGRVRVAIVRAK